MGHKLFTLVDKDGNFITRGRSSKPLTYDSHSNALRGLGHVKFITKEELDIVPYVPMDDLMDLAFLLADWAKYTGYPDEVEKFLNMMSKYDYTMSDDGDLVHKSELE